MSILMVGVGFFSIFLLNDCSKKETHDEPSNVNPAVPAGSGAVVIFNDMANFQIVNGSLYAIAYGNNTYVSVGINRSVKTSTDGIIWNTHYDALDATFSRARSIAYGNNTFVALTDGIVPPSSYYTQKISTSSDGSTWTVHDAP
jgi:hypothetical protein